MSPMWGDTTMRRSHANATFVFKWGEVSGFSSGILTPYDLNDDFGWASNTAQKLVKGDAFTLEHWADLFRLLQIHGVRQEDLLLSHFLLLFHLLLYENTFQHYHLNHINLIYPLDLLIRYLRCHR